jgi:hypothetical protein
MFRTLVWLALFALLVGGCASDGKQEPSSGSSSRAGATVVPADTMSGGAAVSGPTMGAEQAGTDFTPSTASKSRNAAGVEEETLNACLARIPRDASAGQRLLAEQTCRRDFAIRR